MSFYLFIYFWFRSFSRSRQPCIKSQLHHPVLQLLSLLFPPFSSFSFCLPAWAMSDDDDGWTMPAWWIAACVAGSMAGVLVVLLLCICCIRMRRAQQRGAYTSAREKQRAFLGTLFYHPVSCRCRRIQVPSPAELRLILDQDRHLWKVRTRSRPWLPLLHISFSPHDR